jgi:hypothetical protein
MAGLINLMIVVEPGKDRHAFTCRLAELANTIDRTLVFVIAGERTIDDPPVSAGAIEDDGRVKAIGATKVFPNESPEPLVEGIQMMPFSWATRAAARCSTCSPTGRSRAPCG